MLFDTSSAIQEPLESEVDGHLRVFRDFTSFLLVTENNRT